MRYLNAPREYGLIFVRGTTEAVNLVAASSGRPNMRAGDEIVISAMEHHSNIVPWQILCEETGAKLRFIPMDDRGDLILAEYEQLLSPRTRLVAVCHVSNVLGTINPVDQIISMAHAVGAVVLVDGAQAVPHMRIDVRALDADFYAFSGHKLFGPTGVGILYGKPALLEKMQPILIRNPSRLCRTRRGRGARLKMLAYALIWIGSARSSQLSMQGAMAFQLASTLRYTFSKVVGRAATSASAGWTRTYW